ncbi:MAG TPA: divalent-cation tolerance protein CutA [Bryobacteraceae bacterium]|nr:divalent-cation tolerance protein CutA [Bryobacteraceae bacterium]
MTDKIVVLCTCGSDDEGEQIARRLIEKKLAACVSVLPDVRSVYRWQGAISDELETMLVIKSNRALFDELRAEIAKLHSYEVPEIIAIPIVDGSEGYLGWMDGELAKREP